MLNEANTTEENEPIYHGLNLPIIQQITGLAFTRWGQAVKEKSRIVEEEHNESGTDLVAEIVFPNGLELYFRITPTGFVSAENWNGVQISFENPLAIYRLMLDHFQTAP